MTAWPEGWLARQRRLCQYLIGSLSYHQLTNMLVLSLRRQTSLRRNRVNPRLGYFGSAI